MTRNKQSATQPTVSIICRTVNRPTLAQTIASVGKQDWPSIELVLVDATGAGLAPMEAPATTVRLNIVTAGKTLSRPLAANAGLDAASGDYLLFLDDDDWIAPNHISKLMAHVLKHPSNQVVYSKTRKTSADGKLLDDIIAVPFDHTVLRRDNFIPIHAALFSAALVRAGCRFDKNLDVYEDWDFWLQCAEHTDFKQATHIGAYYRMGGDSATMLDEHQQRYQPGHPMADARAKLLHKWRRRWTGEQWNALLGLVDQTPQLKSIHSDLKFAHRAISDRDAQIVTLSDQCEQLTDKVAELKDVYQQLQTHYQQLQNNHMELDLAHEALDRGVREVLNSFSWRVTAPYRWVARRTFNLLKSRKIAHSNQLAEQKEVDPSPLTGAILTPAHDNFLCTPVISLHAWAWSPDPLVMISVSINGTHHGNIDSIPQFNNADDAKRIGFVSLVSMEGLQPGKYQIQLEVTDAQERIITLSRIVFYRDPAATYRQWLDRQQLAYVDNGLHDSPKADGKFLEFQFIVRAISSNDIDALLTTLTDIKRQTEANWNCHILTNDDGRDKIDALLKKHFPDTSRFSCTGKLDLPAANKNSIVCFIYPGERLRETCLNSVSRSWSPETRLLYTDHDQISPDGNHLNPWFTFSWSPDLLLSTNYIGGVYFIDGKLLTQEVAASAAKTPNNNAWRYNLLITLAQAIPSSAIHRLAEVLWSQPELTAAEKEQLFSDETTAVIDAFNQNPQMADAEVIHNALTRYVSWPLKAQPKVSIIIPTTGKMRFLKPCLDTLASTDYANLEIVILDNSRGDHPEGIQYARDTGALVIECDEAFNWSKLNNIGARQGSGEVLLFLNDDIEIIHPNWLTELVRQVMRDDIGTVGCMLLYPNGAIQHAGVFLVDHGGGARHLFHKQLPGKGIYQQLDQCVREVSASTGACLMIRRDRFEELGGFDESLSIVGNDIDLCLRALEAGYRNIWTPHSRLIHHESVSRQSKPIGNDEKSMWKRWENRFTAGDPYYNPALSLLREDCVIAEIPVKKIQEHELTSPDVTTSSYGVNLIAYIRASMGVGEAARGNAAALEASGIPFGIINYEHGNPSKMDNLRWQHREVASPEYSINLVHINADHLPSVIKDLSLEKSMNRYNIGFWAWELPEFPDRWLSSFEHLDEIWVPSNFVNRAIAAKSPVPVVTIPHVVDIDFASASVYQRSDFGIDRDAFVFITMFDIHSIAQRKNPYGAILAFKAAFAADDKRVQLVIKINNADEANLRVLQSHLGAHKNILLIGQHLDRSGIDSLINCVDCYVSLHHSEGFGLGPAEAMALGKATILTNWSGNLEYMRRDNCLAVDYQLKALGRDYGPYEAHQHWAEPDINHAAMHMRTLAGDPDLAKKIGTLGRITIETEFSAQAIGASMKLRLQNIARFREKEG